MAIQFQRLTTPGEGVSTLMDFAPLAGAVNDGITGYYDNKRRTAIGAAAQNGNAAAAQEALKQGELDTGAQYQRLAQQDTDRATQSKDKQIKMLGGIAQAAKFEKDPARRALLWNTGLKRAGVNPADLDPDELDPMTGPDVFLAASGMAQDPRESQLMDLKIAQANKTLTEPSAGSSMPSSVREHQYFLSLPDEKARINYLAMKRANPYLNLGDRFAQPDPMNPGGELGSMGVGLGPDRKIDGNRVIEMPGVAAGHMQPPGLQPPGQPPQPGMEPAPMMNMGQGLGQSLSAGGPPAGGPRITELPQSAEDAKKERGRLATKQRAGTTVVQDLGRAMEMIKKMPDVAKQDGIIGANARALRAGIKGTPEYEVTAYKESALSNVGIDQLQQMRENNPTGGALGQVPFQQQKRLEQMLGSLELGQSVQILEQNMKRIQNIYTDIMYGSAEERMLAMSEGRMTQQQNAEIERRYHVLPFDEMGRPVDQGAPQQQPQPQAQPNDGSPRQGRDGNFYVPDPNRPGKYLRVD